MFKFRVFLVLVSFLLNVHSVVFASREQHNIKPATHSQENSTLRCGEVLIGSIFVEDPILLEYKLDQTLLPNERCIWTVKARGASSYNVTVHSLGYEEANDEHRLILTAFQTFDAVNDFQVVVGEGNYEIYGSVLAITFQTGGNFPDELRGFYISIFPGIDGRQSASDESQHYIVDSSVVGGIKHPPTIARFPNRDVSIFVFVPTNNFFEEERITSVVFANSGISSFNDCTDFLEVFTFNVYSELEHKWNSWGTLCKSNLVEVISNSDIIMIVFRSDLSSLEEEERGFSLSYSGCSG